MIQTEFLKYILEKANVIRQEFGSEVLSASHVVAAVADLCKTKYTGFTVSEFGRNIDLPKIRRRVKMSLGKKIFVVSDVHGHFSLLKEALDSAGFDKENENHLLICCGDYFDRGSENLEVLKFFERLKHKVLLRGNHEDLLLKLLQTGRVLPHNYINGTMQTLTDFFGKYSIDPVDDTIDFSGKTRIVDRICEFIDETVNYFETENYVFVHGWLPQNTLTADERKNASESEWDKARWIKWIDEYKGVKPLKDKTLVCGHVPTTYAVKFDSSRTKHDADIFYGNGLIVVDAATFDTKQINVLVIEDNLL